MTLKKQINKSFKPGEIFSLDDLNIAQNKRASACAMLSQMTAKNEIVRFEKGAYYVPQISKLFGPLPPSETQILKYICKEYNGYFTGVNVYNKIGLTEQVPNIVEIATIQKIPSKTIGNIKIVFKKAYTSHLNKEKHLLQILDAITEIKKIPAKTIKESIDNLKKIIKNLTPLQKQKLTKYAIEYPPRTRYILAEILRNLKQYPEEKLLRNTINNTTRFNYGNSKIISRS